MSTVARPAGFGAGLAVLFGGAAVAGGAIGQLHDRAGTTAESRPAMHVDTGENLTPEAVHGLAVSDNGLTLSLAHTTPAPGRRFDLGFRIADRLGRTVRDFDVEHTKRMHLIVVRRDMTGFQHLHRPSGPTAAGRSRSRCATPARIASSPTSRSTAGPTRSPTT